MADIDCPVCKHIRFNECLEYVDELMYMRYSKSDPIQKGFSSPKPGLHCAYVMVSQKTYEHSRNEHTNPEDALRELIHRLEERHGREHE
jgi:hypothetical protein